MINTELCKELYAGSFFMSTKMFMYPLKQKNSLSACWFLQPSSLPDLLEKSISFPLHPYHSLFNTLQSGFIHFSETVLSGLSVTELNDCFFQSGLLILLSL